MAKFGKNEQKSWCVTMVICDTPGELNKLFLSKLKQVVTEGVNITISRLHENWMSY